MSQHVQVTTAGHITTIRLDRPDKKNAITLDMYAAMADALEAAQGDAAVRAVVLAGGRDCFTAGNDLGDFVRAAQGGTINPRAPEPASPRAGERRTGEPGVPGRGEPIDRAGESQDSRAPGFLHHLATFDKPLVAAVAGVAIGIGTTMLLHCDLIYAAPSARFKTPFVDLALVPEAGSSVLLPALVGTRRAAQLLLLGEQLDAPTALAWGLINGIVDDPDAAAAAAARKLAGCAPGALRATRALTRRASREAVLEAMRIEGEAFAERLRSPEAMEAFQAFLTRRPADFSRF